MARSRSRIEWSGDLPAKLAAFPARVDAAMFAMTESWAPEVEGHMRANATWQDRTGNARQGLRAQAEHSALNHSIVMFHSVPYGIWLEVRWSGRYAIILPTIEHMGPVLMGRVRQLFGAM